MSTAQIVKPSALVVQTLGGYYAYSYVEDHTIPLQLAVLLIVNNLIIFAVMFMAHLC